MKRVRRFFTSDLHFYHDNVITYCSRPYNNAEEMNEDIIRTWNHHVSPIDIVYVLGDAFISKVTAGKEIMSRLNGKIHLIRGNHDLRLGQMESMGFVSVYEKAFLKLNGKMLLLSHYPYKRSRIFKEPRYHDRHPDKGNEDWLIHGHVHNTWGKVNYQHKMINVSWDAWGHPVSESMISSIMAREDKCTTISLLKKFLNMLGFKKKAITEDLK